MTALTKRGRVAVPLVLALLLTVAWTDAPKKRVPASPQVVAVLFSAHTARSAPTLRSRKIEIVRALRPLTGERTTLPVLGRKTANGRTWLRVLLPGRPNGHTGWIKERATTHALNRWRIVVSTGSRRVTAYRNGRAVRSFRAVVGKPSTPTPFGRFFVEEAIQLRRGDVGAPFALALSARSTVLQEFAGGPGQIALHGLSNVGGVLGTAVSHGCIRLDDDVMRWLVTRIGPGVPVTITP